ncbi:hypothetical protein [Bosea sp. Root381]|uniref:hypothetical protein n=1 Tax=Bosea sp. Root381 TaxID=1736524 RepID=UPI0012E36676|nr:hypothetical protein [Bosea sp. Root381]
MTAALKHQATVYGLMTLAALIIIFAAGYALNAGHTMLMFSFGAVTASLIITRCLVATAGVCVVASRIFANRPSATAEKLSKLASPYSAPALRLPYSRQHRRHPPLAQFVNGGLKWIVEC